MIKLYYRCFKAIFIGIICYNISQSLSRSLSQSDQSAMGNLWIKGINGKKVHQNFFGRIKIILTDTLRLFTFHIAI